MYQKGYMLTVYHKLRMRPKPERITAVHSATTARQNGARAQNRTGRPGGGRVLFPVISSPLCKRDDILSHPKL